MQWENFSKMKIGFLVMLVSTSGTTHYNQQCRFSAAPRRLSCPIVPRLTRREDNGACFWFSSFLHTWKIGILFDCHLNKNRIFNLKKDPAWYSYSSLLCPGIACSKENWKELQKTGGSWAFWSKAKQMVSLAAPLRPLDTRRKLCPLTERSRLRTQFLLCRNTWKKAFQMLSCFVWP